MASNLLRLFKFQEATAAERAKEREAEVEVAYDELEEEGLDCTCHSALWCDRVATSEDLKRCGNRSIEGGRRDGGKLIVSPRALLLLKQPLMHGLIFPGNAHSLAERLDLLLLGQPREGYPLLVLDLDRTLIDGTPLDPPMVLRPHTESFLMVRGVCVSVCFSTPWHCLGARLQITPPLFVVIHNQKVHAHYDLGVWSKSASDWSVDVMCLVLMRLGARGHWSTQASPPTDNPRACAPFLMHPPHQSNRLSVKMDLLGISAHRSFRFCLALDRAAMLACNAQTTDKVSIDERKKTCLVLRLSSLFPCVLTTTMRALGMGEATGEAKVRRHLVKPLQIIWSRFPWWTRANTVRRVRTDDATRAHMHV